MPNPLFRSAVTGVRAQQLALDTIANNLANVSTTGYKRVRASFSDLLYERLQAGRVPDPEAAPAPVRVGGGTRADDTTRLLHQGALQETGRVLDLAIVGEGFFAVRTPEGQPAYTRDGTLSIDADGRLTTAQGDLVEPAVVLPEDLDSLRIDERGTIYGTRAGSAEELTLGQLQLTRFTNPAGLAALGGNRFAATPNSGPAEPALPGEGGRGQVASGFLEASNVDIGAEMTSMVQAQRAYQINLKALQTIDEMTGQALQLRR